VALIHIQGRYTEVNIDQNTEENVTLELTESGIFEFGATWNTIVVTLQA
jgi:hypothetical protein